MFNPEVYRSDFPILQKQVHGKPLVYLDNAATSQKPNQVIEAMANYYRHHNANVHRGVHQLGDESTHIFHLSRQIIADFFGADVTELVAVRNTTEAVNQVAWTWGEENIKAGDVLVSTEMEHHSNLVPWQELAKRKGAELQFMPVNRQGELEWRSWLEQHPELYSRIKLLALSHVSNTLGTVNPLAEITTAFRSQVKQVVVFVDGAQAAPHLPVNFHDLDVEFYAVSAHKMLGPMGMGGLLVKSSLLKQMSPFLFGGGMIDEVALTKTTYAEDLEDRFTAGTPDVAGLVGWAAACEYLKEMGMDTLLEHDQDLVKYSYEQLSEFGDLELIGVNPLVSASELVRVGSVAFIYPGVHAHDIGQVLDSEGVAVRSGHHCTMPLHTKFGWAASSRVSFHLYNTRAEIDALLRGLQKVKQVFGV